MKIKKFHHTVLTAAPPEKIWYAWTDVERWPEWDSELVSATLDGSFALGTKGRVKPKRGPAARFSISELIPGKSYTFTTRLPLCEVKVSRRLTRNDGGGAFFTTWCRSLGHCPWCSAISWAEDTGKCCLWLWRTSGRPPRADGPGVGAASYSHRHYWRPQGQPRCVRCGAFCGGE